MSKTKILIAEDDYFLARYLQKLMSRWDCDLAVEQTASDAISRAATFQPDTALIGFVTEPGVDGAKAGIELLRVSPDTQIVLFNESVPADIVSELKARGYNFLTLAAPFDEKELRDCCFPLSHRKAG
jgi:DNA-binding NtrC family response regulator